MERLKDFDRNWKKKKKKNLDEPWNSNFMPLSEFNGQVWCVTPFGYDKTNICTNPTLARQAVNYFYDSHKTTRYTINCLNPCNQFLFYMFKISEYNQTTTYATAWLFFNEYIKTTTSHYSYLTLSLIAEIGGYVGLFLGVSLYQTTDIIDAIKNRLN